MPIVLSALPAASDWAVVALCAEWCGTCRDYRPLLAARASAMPDEVHLWVDIEDDADQLGDLDIETFPTLLVLHRGRPLFFGPVLPQIDVVDRLLQTLRGGAPADAPVAPENEAAVRWLAGQAITAR
ncbi:MAG TPA: thioredoxin family protein [Burkholderiaceae bacterium]|nr:thioredoxin family protein [Burkholderiaceae bacterium]HQR75726.1 thioredoxin family protein [Burkholderiaceae bacterium]